MGEVSTIGLDIAKSVFQIHGVDAAGAMVIRKRITRAKLLEFLASLPACLIGIEACPTAHYWSRPVLWHQPIPIQSIADRFSDSAMARRDRYAEKQNAKPRSAELHRLCSRRSSTPGKSKIALG